MDNEVQNTSASDDIVRIVDRCLERYNTKWQQEHTIMLPGDVALDTMRMINIDLPRAMGHSTAALKLAVKYPKSLILYPCARIMEHNRNNGELYEATEGQRYACSNHWKVTDDFQNIRQLITDQLDLVIFDTSMMWASLYYVRPPQWPETQKENPASTVGHYDQINELARLLSMHTKMFVRLG